MSDDTQRLGAGIKPKSTSHLPQFARDAPENYTPKLHAFLSGGSPDELDAFVQEVHRQMLEIESSEFCKHPHGIIMKLAVRVGHAMGIIDWQFD